MNPTIRPDLPPPFHELNDDTFENLCRDLFAVQPGISTCERYGTRGHAQYGIDLLALCSDTEGSEVGQCKCCKKFTPAEIKNASEEFLKNQKHWGKWSIKSFILFVACDLSTPKHHEQIRKEKSRFKKKGIKYEAWSATIIRQKLRSHYEIVANYCDPPEHWVARICGQKMPPSGYLATVFHTSESINQSNEMLIYALSSTKAKDLDLFREMVREGKAKETLSLIQNNRRSAEWPLLDKKVRADLLSFEAGLVLQIEKNLSRAHDLVSEAKTLYPEKDYTIIHSLLRCYEDGPKSAIRELQQSKKIDVINLHAALLLDLGNPHETIDLLKEFSINSQIDAESMRLLALANISIGNVSQALYEIEKAAESKPRWLSIRIAQAIVYYLSCLSSVTLKNRLPLLPSPTEWALINRDDESLHRLRKAEDLFRGLVKEYKNEPNFKQIFQVWRLACLFIDPEKQTEAEQYCIDLLESKKIQPIVIIWAIVNRIEYQYIHYQNEFESRINNDDFETEQIIALILIYLNTNDTDKALDTLDRTKTHFQKLKDPFTWQYWKAQTLLKSGKLSEVLLLADHLDNDHFQTEVYIMALKYALPSSNERPNIIAYLEKVYKESDDREILLQICLAKANKGKQEDWKYIASFANDLVLKVNTGVSLRLAAISLFNTEKYDNCLQIIDNHHVLFPNGHLSMDLRRLKIQCQTQLGILSQALLDAQEIAHDEPSSKNLIFLMEVQYRHGDRFGMITTAQKILRTENPESFSLLQAAKLIHLENKELSIHLWRKAIKTGIHDQHVPEAYFLGFNLGLDNETDFLKEKMAKLSINKVSGVQAVSVSELVEMRKLWLADARRILHLYETAKAPIHLVEHKLKLILSQFYLKRIREDVTTFDPLHQPITYSRYGGRQIIENASQLDDSNRLFMDITALLTAEFLGMLDKVEACFKPIYISPSLPAALVHERESFSNPQPTLLNANKKIIELYNLGIFFAIPTIEDFECDLDEQINKLGLERAYLLHQAKSSGGYIADFLPLRSLDTEFDHIELIDEDANKFINAWSLATVLYQEGKLSEYDYEESIAQLGIEGKEFPSATMPQLGDTIYLNIGIPKILAKVNLLNMVCKEFDIKIFQSDIVEAKEKIEQDISNHKFIEMIGKIVDRLNDGIISGKYQLLTVPPQKTEPENSFKDNPIFRSFSDLLEYIPQTNDIIWIDDRCINRFMTRDEMVPIIGVNEILIFLKFKKILSENEYYRKLLMLRKANCRYIPVTKNEIIFHLEKALTDKTQFIETNSLAVLRQYIAACFLDSGRIQFPSENKLNEIGGEIPFVLNNRRVVEEVLIWIWNTDIDEDTAVTVSNWVFSNLYVGISGIRHLSPALKNKENSLELIGLDIGGLVSQGIQLFKVNYIEKNEFRKLNSYFNWLDQSVLQKRFHADQNALKMASSMLKSVLLNLESKEKTDFHHKDIFNVLSLFIHTIPKIIKDEMVLDSSFTSCLDIQAGTVVQFGEIRFEAKKFYKKLADVAKNEKQASLVDFKTGEKYNIKQYEHIDDKKKRIIAINTKTKEEHKIEHPVFPLLNPDINIREAFLREHRDWFDCANKLFEVAITEIVSIKDPFLRVRKVGDWHLTSAAVYYNELKHKIQNKAQFKFDELLPPNLEGILRHLRLNITSNKDNFKEIIEEATSNLIIEEGLSIAFERLCGLPIILPISILKTAEVLDHKEKVKLLNYLKARCYSPVSKIHLIWLLLHLANDDEYFFEIAKEECELLKNETSSEESFNAFIAILKWVYNKFYIWPESKNYCASKMLALTWTHANQIYNLFSSVNAPSEFIIEQFENRRHNASPEIFDRDLLLWNDISHPMRLSRELFLLTGLGVTLKDCNKTILDELGLCNLAHSLAFIPIEGEHQPTPNLFLNTSLALNSMNSFMGIDKLELRDLLGDKNATGFGNNKLNELALEILDELEKDPNNLSNLFVLYHIISDFVLAKDLSLKVQQIYKKIDLGFIKKTDFKVPMLVLNYICRRISLIEDIEIKKNIKNQLIDLARFLSKNESGSLENDLLKESFPDSKQLFIESIWAATVEQNPEDSCKNFSELMANIINVWPEFGSYVRPIIFRLVNELPVRLSKELWELVLLSRACK